MSQSLGVSVADVIENPDRVNSIDFGSFENEVGRYTLTDIRDEMLKPARDPRKTFKAPQFRDDVREITDLKKGMEIEGTVTNVTNFGAFVDLGVHQDGLIHISELSHRYIRDAREAVTVGDVGQGPGDRRGSVTETNQPVDEGDCAQAPTEAQTKAKTKTNGTAQTHAPW